MKKRYFPMIFIIGLLGAAAGTVLGIYIFLPAYMGQLIAVMPAPGSQVVERVYYTVNSTFQEQVFHIIEANRNSVVYVKAMKTVDTVFGSQQAEASGSGFVISGEGYIVTNHHVVADSDNLSVTLGDGTELPATLIGTDPLNDVAVVKVNPASVLDTVEIGDSSTIEQGEIVLAIGSPFRLQNTVTLGIVSGVNRTLTSGGGYRIEDVIQTDAAINPGNSGGPLLSLDGKVIGINTAIISTSGGSEGVGFAIPINTAQRIFREIIDTGKVTRPWMGINGVDVTDTLAQTYGLDAKSGVLVVDFTEYSPARDAGMHETISRPGQRDYVAGDIIVEIGGDAITGNSDLLNALLKHTPGETIGVKVLRNSAFMTINVELGERPQGM